MFRSTGIHGIDCIVRDAFLTSSFYMQGMSPDVVTYTTLMKALIKAEQFDQVDYSYLYISVHFSKRTKSIRLFISAIKGA